MIEFPKPKLPLKADRAVFNNSNIAIAEWCSPKSFRLESGLAWLASRAFAADKDNQFWWIGPDFGSCVNAMNVLKSALTPGSFTQAQRAAEYILMNGAKLIFKNAENSNALYSDAISAAVIDQAISIPEKSWAALQRSFTNTHCGIRILSTVAGKANWFYEFARETENKAETDPDRFFFSRFTCNDALENNLLSLADIDYARSTLPDHIFRSLYLAEPYDDRVEAAHRAADPKLMTDTELAIIANIDPNELDLMSDDELINIANELNSINSYSL